MRAARLIRMVLLLQSRPSMTGAELARELEVSERTVTRDVLALSEAGVPVYADRGRAGGYRLVGGYRTRLTGLGRTEAEALFLSGVPSALREMGLHDAGSAARLKVAAALLPELRDAPAGAAQRFHLDAPGWWQEPATPELLPVVAEAVWGDRLLEAVYRRKDGAGAGEVRRRLEPYGLVLKAGVWYLAARAVEAAAPDGARAGGPATPGGPAPDGPAPGRPSAEARSAEARSAEARSAEARSPKTRCAEAPSAEARSARTRCTEAPSAEARPVEARSSGAQPSEAPSSGGTAGGPRVYRVDRFAAAEVAEEGFTRDEHFDLPRFWQERAAAFARSILRETVVVRLSEAGARRLPYVTDRVAGQEAVAAAGEPDGQGRITVTLPVESQDVAFSQLLSLGAEAEVLEPAALRARFAEAAARLAERYR
ncbi:MULTISPECIES: helix-turn-helix transcriptional regulator [Streptomyces]|uniref:WYL domain-containing protein n=1 Tax=Streptomyces lycii TaxID=2654337 RepID=A0ABQ7FFE3_9ACTN|nr:WYL domain-containing protein [Streptomyces lycii]KAF4407238.1 WYL domain-containing protein [Streptomyces lycii]